MRITPLRKDLILFAKFHNLNKKLEKALTLIESNISHPSLKVELLEPKWRGIYSFRLDKKYRALFLISKDEIEIFSITNHYKK